MMVENSCSSKRLAACFGLMILFLCISAPSFGKESLLKNGSFEQWSEQNKALDWYQEGESESAKDCETSHSGKCSFHIRGDGKKLFQINQAIKLDVAAGTQVSISGWIKVRDHSEGLASLWLRIDNDERRRESFDNMAKTSPHGTQDWTYFQLTLDTTPRSKTALAGILLSGNGEAWFDDVTVTISSGAEQSKSESTDPALISHPFPFGSKPVFLKPHIKDKRIILLGESSHGVSEFSSAKIQTIKYLHEELGYNVIAFEAPFSECSDVDHQITEKAAADLMKSCLPQIWHTDELIALFEYVRKARSTGSQLHIAGFDVQSRGLSIRAKRTLAQIDLFNNGSLLQKAQSLETGTVGAAEQAFALAGQYENLTKAIAILTKNLGSLAFQEQVKELQAEISSRIAQTYFQSKPSASKERFETRDKGMFNNFSFLADEKYKNNKIIIWAHNAHIAKSWPLPESPKTLGHHIHEKYGENAYMIGLMMGSGEAALNNRAIYSIVPPATYLLEGIMKKNCNSACFIDILSNTQEHAGHLFRREIITRDWGRNDITLTPAKSFDAFIYIDKVSSPMYSNS
ncbi:erythromycin esterase family protein [Massilia sp. BJB1822]|uniref:erythromycin esterase family protein n=1 Tax=Massilia sp. BJB1822 TaxID=2744470 RepID=UPI00159315DC|nr:erythromycin esterase family protein [Massilia sp. BJB1822]NVD97406.1 erythromycin esterase family protein [Massilia sp. BJB1822]